MTEPDRRQQILQAEEAILQLADQLARARQSRSAADEATGHLQTAQAVLEQTRAALQETMRALQENTQLSSSALAGAIDHLEKTRGELGQAAGEMDALAKQVGEITPTLHRYLETALGEIAQAVRLGSQGQEVLRKEVVTLRRLIWVLLALSLLAFSAALTSLVIPR